MPPISAQLYTVRAAFDAEPDTTIARIATIGFTQLEPYGLVDLADRLAGPVAAHGLAMPTAHASLLGADTNAAFAAANRLGVTTLIDPFVARERWTTPDDVRAIAAEFTALVEPARAHGIRIGYHNHEHEVVHQFDGLTALEYFAQHVDPAVVLEVDTYWASAGGADPVALLRRLGDRVAAIHIKDGPATLEPTDQVALGRGSMPIPELLAVAPNALPVVELDDTRGDLFDALAESYRYLSGLGRR